MKWSVFQLNRYRDTGININETVDVSDLMERESQIKKIDPVTVTGRGDIGAGKITFQLHITGEMILPCSRTLEDVEYPLDIHTVETFLLSDNASMYEDEDIHSIDGETLDLLPYVKENILLEVPLQIFKENIEEGQETEAPPKGNDWELISENEKPKQLDPRLAELAKFFDKN
ncbi:hypothetical protein CIB95_02680 [Lottiidibacillus patelloidae]|uniref:DUF177 domain-containing protein n=1 Tax=Lottiidibacillus patelloidae TaxID=2670334 RepID=A0A263BXK0_9BACI|nr:YceD family protein [Lottiidibacillus patelloidae]OZM58491.1 hypothetical protein CIB95_02680 [Lottiidibacillus patelloidae]